MKLFKRNSCAASLGCAGLLASLLSAPAFADTFTFAESAADKLKCSTVTEDGESFTECTQKRVGSFAIRAQLSPETLSSMDFDLETIAEDTPVSIEIGSFTFQGTLADADRKQLTASKVSANWNETYELCTRYDADDNCVRSRDAIHTRIAVNGSSKGLLVAVKGVNQSTDDGQGDFGDTVFSEMCEQSGEGTDTTQADATVTIGEIVVNTTLDVTCNVKVRSVDRGDETFDLSTIKVTAKLAAPDDSPQ